MSRPVLSLGLCLLLSAAAYGEENSDSLAVDTTAVTLDQTIYVVGRRLKADKAPFPFEKERFHQVLTGNGFGLISKGVFLAQDIQGDGFKRDDISIVVDGERYHSACPNRMDSPLTRSNSLEMDVIELDKTSSSCCSGIGGSVAYRRQPIGDHDQLRAGISQSAGASDASDFGFAATTRHHRLGGRYAVGSGYTDGDGLSFVERYGYRNDFTYQLAEGSITGENRGVEYRAQFTYTDDVMFPYLQMDERLNRVYSGFVSYRGHKLYTNYTEHLMDNGLRLPMPGGMSMATDAINTTVGIIGPVYEAFYRRWDADNAIVTMMGRIDNALMPAARQVGVTARHSGVYHGMTYWARAGVSHFSIGEGVREAFYQPLYPGQEASRTFPSGALGVAVRKHLSQHLTGVVTSDASVEPPTAQSLYIAVQRPMGAVWWSGNPSLDAPVRASLRTKLEARNVTLETSATHVWNYVELAAATAGSQAYQTYENIDALFLSANLRGEWRYVTFAAGYTWSQGGPDDTPLAEIPPFYLTYTLTTPRIARGAAYWRHTYNDAQTRVDVALSELTTASWHRFDIGVNYDMTPFRLSVEVENITDEFYTQHLSYVRDPFSAGRRVYEPGRTLRANVVLLSGTR